MIKTIFIGTSDFAVPILKSLLEFDQIQIDAVITQPDKPVGRKQILTPPPVKQFLIENNFDKSIYQPEKLKLEAERILSEMKPDLIIVASYGQMIPKNMLDYPKYSCLNIHASILPILRGAVPMPMAILQGFKSTGVTIQIMDEKMDIGDIIANDELKIDDKETTQTLTDKLSSISAKMIVRVLPDWIEGKIAPQKQDETKATYCYKVDMSKEKAKLENSFDAVVVDRTVRAFYPWPIAWSRLRSPEQNKQDDGIEANADFVGKIFKIYEGEIVNQDFPHKKGLKLFKSGKDLLLRCDIGWYKITKCQLEGKKMMSGSEYLFLATDTTNRVRGIIINNGKILLIKRRKMGREFYAIPGGSIGVNETQQEALQREIFEETSLEINVLDQVFTIDSEDGISKHFVYNVEVLDEIKFARMNGEESQYNKDLNSYELEWVEVSEIHNLEVPEELKKHLS